MSLQALVVASKTLGPSQELEFMGIVLDSIRMEARRPDDKLNRAREILNLVPRAFPLKNGWGGKRPWHRLVTCPLVHPKILGVIN